MSLRQDEVKSLGKAIDGTIISSAITRLYQASPNPREYSLLNTGVICLTNASNGSQVFNLVDLNTFVIVWELILDFDLKYTQDRPFFHSFLGNSCMIGLSFASENEAAIFSMHVLKRDQFKKPHHISTTKEEEPAYTSQQFTTQKKDKESKSIFGMLSKSKSEKKLTTKIDKSMISAPSEFKHLSHVGYDPKAGFSASNIPTEWKVIFSKAGITEEQLKDKKTAKMVEKFMKEHKASGGLEGVTRTPPPPPPNRSGRTAPPPPPLSRDRIPSIAVNTDSTPRPTPPRPTYATSRISAAPTTKIMIPPLMPPRSNNLSKDLTPDATSFKPVSPPMPRIGLMADISAGTKILKASGPVANQLPLPNDPRGSLLSSIRLGNHLKKASDEPSVERERENSSEDIADLLRMALARRVIAVAGEDSDDEEKGDDDW